MVESKLLNELTAQAEKRTAIHQNQNFIIKTMNKRFGDSPSHETIIRSVIDLDRLDRMQAVLLTVASWDELVAVS